MEGSSCDSRYELCGAKTDYPKSRTCNSDAANSDGFRLAVVYGWDAQATYRSVGRSRMFATSQSGYFERPNSGFSSWVLRMPSFCWISENVTLFLWQYFSLHNSRTPIESTTLVRGLGPINDGRAGETGGSPFVVDRSRTPRRLGGCDRSRARFARLQLNAKLNEIDRFLRSSPIPGIDSRIISSATAAALTTTRRRTVGHRWQPKPARMSVFAAEKSSVADMSIEMTVTINHLK
ncbi:uncharacterized protein LOC129720359 [Wyeomyia smithii]|uniref:uncharacterized protein LOC129720359 n=1 Tax=Wyeomyia smithii TaxID=174621 RepID=UPI002467BBDE|nr:uncharacterized protein LOC129720359 [Wyeomyia smithii]